MSSNKGVFDKEKLLSGRPDGLHKGSGAASTRSGGGGSEVDIEGIIEKSGCSVPYFALEECLGLHDRDWRKCQDEVRALRVCNQAQQEMNVKKNDKA
jgi:hypothetical protein